MRKLLLLVLAGALALGGAASATNVPTVAAAPGGGPAGIASGTLDVETVNGCYLLMTGTVTTNPVGGTVSAWVSVFDDGVPLGSAQVKVPGDGGTHAYQASYQQLVPVNQSAPGVGVVLVDAPGNSFTVIFDIEDPYTDISDVCTGPAPDISGFDATAIPTLGQIGLALLVGLLALAAVVVMMRRRSAPHA